MEYVRLLAEKNVDMNAECFFQYVYGYKDRFNPHCHDFYEIVLTVKGTVAQHVNGIEQRLPEGTLYFIRPDDCHGYRYDDEESLSTEYVNLTFTRQTADELFSYLSDGFPSEALLRADMPPTVYLSAEQTAKLVSRIRELNCADWEDKQALKFRMRVLLIEVFSKYFDRYAVDPSEQIPAWLSELTLQMERPKNFILGSDRMIELSGRTREHVARSLKKYYGLCPSEYINRLRINYACNLLLNTNASILSICFDCGFQSLSYFYRVFRQYRGMSVHEFRKKHGR